ncbi:heavy metal-binding domain-containing protein [Acidithiobacillus montserratensis]|uniref:Heavy metal-binding domain-containing protein n=1 Tax=Acidithiobacillus montserratensis TaxID=2729135 RepID=A0ACD5HD12_9PROT|nr:heavy metal-binding domain-containing protein [Acidithiobacillus montserratensis]MBN2679617.1 heavy metal-binding domain-containing protein [Acidithiobacillaceae bacterium]MBU2747496.1 YbjQ family protein [Acidithiobacillus montserratensis]
MLIVTTNDIPGHQVQRVLGATFGIAVRSRNIAGNFTAGFAAMFGGKQKGNTNLIQQTRQDALDALAQAAAEMGGNAILAVRFDAGEFDSGGGNIMQEVVAYGTVVVIQDGSE